MRPLQLALDGLATTTAHFFLPLEEFVCETEMWLDDDVETTSTNVAAREC
jgi:hypothetical protein